MLKELFDRIQETALPILHEVDGTVYAISPRTCTKVATADAHPEALELNSLDALVKLVTTEALNGFAGTPATWRFYVTVPTHKTVKVFTWPDPERRFFRQTIYEVTATDVPGWSEKETLGFEEAQIALRTRFQETPDTLYAMKLLSDITMGASVQKNDNGVATTITTKKGVALQENVQIKPILELKPYRTFQEVEQPLSKFLIRIGDRGISFIEADGGMWRLAARNTVKTHLEDALRDYVEAGRVYVAL